MLRRDRKVLVVDDNPINLEILAEAIGDYYTIRFAESGAEAIRIAERFQPGFILLDVMMPDMDGLQACHALRRLPNMDECVIIMVSAKAMPSEQAAGLRAGADDYITKPFDEVELLETLRRFTEPRPKTNDSIEVVQTIDGQPNWNS